MDFKQTFSNIYNTNYNKIKRCFDLDLKTDTNTNFSFNENDPTSKKRRCQQSSLKNEGRFVSQVTNRPKNGHFQFSNDLGSILKRDSYNNVKPFDPNVCTPTKKPKCLLVDTNKPEEVNDNPFITPPSSAIKRNDYFFNSDDGVSYSDQNKKLIKEFQSLKIKKELLTCHQIFTIPEILNNIIKYIALNENGLELEKPYKQRPPQSFRHALLIYKDHEKAKKVWEKTKKMNKESNSFERYSLTGNLFNCLMVNKLWFEITFPYFLKNLIFKDSTKFIKYIDRFGKSNRNINNSSSLNTQRLIFNRVAKTQDINETALDNIYCLKSIVELKIHVSPEFILPSNCFHNFNNLQNLSITGNKIINDTYIINISPFLKELISFDLRACENVTDIGVVAIALNCQKIKSINLGRHHNGDKITDIALVALGRYTNVETIGLAGCSITDNGLWEFAKWNGDNVERLSLNNCKLLTDYSIPYLLGFNYFPKLCVLEIRFLDNLKDVRLIVKFKL